MKEIWKPVVGYEGYYEVSSIGRVRSVDRFVRHNFGGLSLKKGCNVKNHQNKLGYLQVSLSKQGKKKLLLVHRLVATAFIPNLLGLPQVHHKDDVKNHCDKDNLEWTTGRLNKDYAMASGLIPKGEKQHWAFMTKEKVLQMRNLYSQGVTHIKTLAEVFNISEGGAYAIIHRRNWKHI